MKPGWRFRWQYQKADGCLTQAVIVKVDQDESLTQLLEAFEGFLLATGFSKETVKKCVQEWAEEE